MLTTIETTVREIAFEDPSSIRVFELLGIDYCCGGKRPLSDACTRANVDLSRALELLESARCVSVPESAQWNNKPLQFLIAHIVSMHHGYVRQETPRIQMLLTKVLSKHGLTHPEIARIQRLFTAIDQELSTHMLKEEQVLFPHVVQLEHAVQSGRPIPTPFFGTVKHPIANMMAEHDDAGALLAEIRTLANDFKTPAGACPTFVALFRGLEEFERDLHHHVHLENNILFPRAVSMEEAAV